MSYSGGYTRACIEALYLEQLADALEAQWVAWDVQAYHRAQGAPGG